MTSELSGCVITNADGELLLIHRNVDTLKQWETIGGKVEPGESSQGAAVREAKEEAGIDVRLIRKLGEQAFEQQGKAFNYTWWHAEIVGGRPSPQEPMHDEVGWFTVYELRHKEDLSPNVVNLLKKIVDGEVVLSV
jgi:8-oxo-dGTP pyrophosphatase MutT (NUDIX family)